MFIKKKKINGINYYFVEDYKSKILHYFSQEIKDLKISKPFVVYIKIDAFDRQFYRTKIIDLFRKIVREKQYECHFVLSEEYQKIKNKLNKE